MTTKDDAIVNKMAFAYVGERGISVSIGGIEDVLAAARPIIEREAFNVAATQIDLVVNEILRDYGECALVDSLREKAKFIRALIPRGEEENPK